MNGLFPDRFKCPVCLEIPDTEIVQCRNGHMLCINCSQDLLTCPQCRLIFETPKIRNRALEDLLDTMKFSCEHKALGCTAVLTRKDISSHVRICLFGRALPQAISDLKQNHAFIACQNTNVDIHLTGLDKLAVAKRSMWTPVLIEKEKKLFIILCSLMDHGQTLSVSGLEICESGSGKSSSSYKVMFSISPTNSEENPEITWTTKPVQIKHIAMEMYNPVFRFSFRLLSRKYSRINSIVLKCSILKSRSYPGRLNAKVVTAINTPCANFQPGFSLEEWLKWLSIQGAPTETQEQNTVSQTVQQTGPSVVAALPTATATSAPSVMDLTSWFPPIQLWPSTSQAALGVRRTTFSLRQPVFIARATTGSVVRPSIAEQGAIPCTSQAALSSEGVLPANGTTRVHTFSLKQPVFGSTATFGSALPPSTAEQDEVNPNSNKIFKRKFPF